MLKLPLWVRRRKIFAVLAFSCRLGFWGTNVGAWEFSGYSTRHGGEPWIFLDGSWLGLFVGVVRLEMGGI